MPGRKSKLGQVADRGVVSTIRGMVQLSRPASEPHTVGNFQTCNDHAQHE